MKNNEHISIFYEGQDDLVEILATSMCSICYNTNSFIDFFILDCGISSFNKRMINLLKDKFDNFSIEYIPVDLKQFEGLKGWPAGSKFLDCYSRLLIPELKNDINKAIYLDSDIIALDDICKLWNEDIENYDFGACPDIGYNKFFQENCVKKLGVDRSHIYANAGVLLINCERWRCNNISNKLIKIAKDNKDDILVIIEDILSVLYNGNNYKILNNRYNLADRTNEIGRINAEYINDDYMNDEWKNVVLQHLSPGKAWKILKNNYNNRELKFFSAFWFFAHMTPYYHGMLNKYIFYTNELLVHFNIRMSKPLKVKYKFLGIPIFVIRRNNNKTKYQLFGCITIFTSKEN